MIENLFIIGWIIMTVWAGFGGYVGKDAAFISFTIVIVYLAYASARESRDWRHAKRVEWLINKRKKEKNSENEK